VAIPTALPPPVIWHETKDKENSCFVEGVRIYGLDTSGSEKDKVFGCLVLYNKCTCYIKRGGFVCQLSDCRLQENSALGSVLDPIIL